MMIGYKGRRAGAARSRSMLIALGIIILIVAAVVLYPKEPTSSTLYCGILEFVEFPAQSVVGNHTFNVTQTMTTIIDYTATTSVPGPIGHTFANSTTGTNSVGFSTGVETICRYVSLSSSK